MAIIPALWHRTWSPTLLDGVGLDRLRRCGDRRLIVGIAFQCDLDVFSQVVGVHQGAVRFTACLLDRQGVEAAVEGETLVVFFGARGPAHGEDLIQYHHDRCCSDLFVRDQYLCALWFGVDGDAVRWPEAVGGASRDISVVALSNIKLVDEE